MPGDSELMNYEGPWNLKYLLLKPSPGWSICSPGLHGWAQFALLELSSLFKGHISIQAAATSDATIAGGWENFPALGSAIVSLAWARTAQWGHTSKLSSKQAVLCLEEERCVLFLFSPFFLVF